MRWAVVLCTLALAFPVHAGKKKAKTAPRKAPAAVRPVKPATVAARGNITVIAREAHVRAGPGTSHRHVAYVRAGQNGVVTERTRAALSVAGMRGANPWYRVRFGNLSGWIWGGLFRFGGAPAPKPKPAPKPRAPAGDIETFHGTGTVFASVLNLRAGPSVGSKDIGNLLRGTRVGIVARTRKAHRVSGYRGAFRWYKARAAGKVGWSWGGYINVGGKSPPQRQPGGGAPHPAPPAVSKRPVEPYSNVGTVFAKSLNVRAEPRTDARILGELAYAKVVRLTARTKHAYWVRGYSRSYRWYRVQTGGLVGWSWGGFISVGKRTPPQRKPGGGAPCDPRRANCNRHTPGGQGPKPPPPGPFVPSSGAAISVFPVAGKHWSWHKQACGYNDYYTGRGPNHANGHLGNDVFATLGTPIVAPVSGSVVRAGWGGSVGGNRVTIRRGNWYFYHAHMNSVSVRAGQEVKAGQKIGTLGKTGSASGTQPHLHFSIYPNDNYEAGVNPYHYLVKVDRQCNVASR